MFPGRDARCDDPYWRHELVDAVVRRGERDVTEIERAHMVSQYDGALAYMDAEVGRLVDHLEARGVLEDTLLAPGRAVLEVGGGLVNDPEAWRLLREHAFVAWLKARPEELLRRVQAQGDLRPMAGWADPLREIRALEVARAPGYGQADQAVDTEARGVEGAVAAIAARVG